MDLLAKIERRRALKRGGGKVQKQTYLFVICLCFIVMNIFYNDCCLLLLLLFGTKFLNF